MLKSIGKDILFGVAVGDALGVPFEFSSREDMIKSPATDMVGYRIHNQSPGTWSDDSSLTFCLAQALVEGYSLERAAQYFVNWKNKSYWTAHQNVFDIGLTTSQAISRLEYCLKNELLDEFDFFKYGGDERENGNGALMRILPFIVYVFGKPIDEQFDLVWKQAALTHRHIRSAMSCLIYLKFAENLINGQIKEEAYKNTRIEIQQFWMEMDFAAREQACFTRVIQNDISSYSEDSIRSGGYVIESLEASLWCILKTSSYKEAVLRAINFGHDTDTTGAITGGLAGLIYSYKQIPSFWLLSLARMEDIDVLGEELDKKFKR